MSEEILINKMYSGDYTISNIGHEIINFFKTDDGKEYIYVLSSGGINKEHSKKIKYILLTGRVSDNRVEILAKVEEPELIYDGGKNNGDEVNHKKQLEVIEKNKICYGGMQLDKIFESNISNKTALYVTYKAKNIIKPNCKIFISNNNEDRENLDKKNGDNIIIKISKNLKRGLKHYVSSSESEKDYRKVENIILSQEFWENEDETTKVPKVSYEEIKKNVNFMELIDKENDEIIFTNMLYYWFSRKDMFNKFMEYCKLNIHSKFEKDEYNLKKEKVTTNNKGRMDIFAEGEKNVVIIENKIDSGINGINKENESNLETQLDNYFKDAMNKCEESSEQKNKEKLGLIFVPDYNKHKIEKEIEKYKVKERDKFSIVTYDMLYEFFSNQQNTIKDDIYDAYYEDFLKSLKKKSYKSVDEKEKAVMEHKFLLAIAKAKQNSNN